MPTYECNSCHVVESAPARVSKLVPYGQTLTDRYLTVTASPVSSVSPLRLFNSGGLVKSDLRGGLLDTTLHDQNVGQTSPRGLT
jgi:hypothetical protein